MRRFLAAAVDALAVALLGYLAFRLAVPAAACKDMSNCALLTPLVAVFILAALAVYFGGAYLLWRRTLGQRLLGE